MPQKHVLDKLSTYVPLSKVAQKPVERLMKLSEKKDRSINYLVVEAISEGTGSSDPNTVGASDIRMLVLIDRLQLTHDQMQKVHDILAGLLDKVTALQAKAQALANDLLAFNGTEAELNQKLTSFKADVGTPLRDTIKQLGDVLTYNQGKLLQRVIKARLAGLAAISADSGAAAPNVQSAPDATQTPSKLGFLLNGPLAQGSARRGALLSQLLTNRAQVGQGQRLRRIMERVQGGTPQLERFVKLLELKLAQSAT